MITQKDKWKWFLLGTKASEDVSKAFMLLVQTELHVKSCELAEYQMTCAMEGPDKFDEYYAPSCTCIELQAATRKKRDGR